MLRKFILRPVLRLPGHPFMRKEASSKRAPPISNRLWLFARQGQLVPMSLCLNAEDTEAIFVVVESDALDDTGDFLRR
jgi:hypothetical protein